MKILATYDSCNKEDTNGKKLMVWPDSMMIRSGKPLFMPEDGNMFLHFGLGVRIDAVGKSIKEKFAAKYYNDILVMAFLFSEKVSNQLNNGTDPSANDIMRDYSLICSNPLHADELGQDLEMHISLKSLNSDITFDSQNIKILNFRNTVAKTISESSRLNTLKTGDIAVSLLGTFVRAEKNSLLRVYANGDNLIMENKLK